MRKGTIEELKAYWRYVKYICEHKKNVMKAYRKISKNVISTDMKIKLFWRCVFHDMSKFGPSEFIQYAHKWELHYTDDETIIRYNEAWVHHYTHNKHHPQYWGQSDMDILSILEMLCDWEAMGYKNGSMPHEYYSNNKHKIKISDNTRVILETFLEGMSNEDTLV